VGEEPGPFGTLSVGLMPDACRTHWNRFLGRAYPARRTPRKRAARALSPVSAPMTARPRGVRERMCRAAVTPEISTTTSLTISVVR